MQKKIYSIRDSKGELYNQPFFLNTHGEAERTFRSLANDPKSMVGMYPEDYDLFHIGEFDDSTGVLTPLPTPTHIAKGISMKKPEQTVLN